MSISWVSRKYSVTNVAWQLVHNEWLFWDLGNSTIILGKAIREKTTLQKALRSFDCCKSIRKQIRPSSENLRPNFVFVWFCKSKESLS